MLGSLTDGSQDRLPNQLVDWSSQNIATYGLRMSAFINTNLNFFGPQPVQVRPRARVDRA